MNLLVAVSGGVDSVVLLDMVAKKKAEHRIVVAHFDHGIREDSAADARFVAELAKQYGLPFVTKREELGVKASEALARARRYAFLHEQARLFSGTIVTAHHQDDIIETIVINLIRGTRWRGLAVFGNTSVLRPLLGRTKADIYEYASKHNLEWVEDETNHTARYLRNRIRAKLYLLTTDQRRAVIAAWTRQRHYAHQITIELRRFADIRSRYVFIMLPGEVALELLRQCTRGKLTYLQVESVLHFIKAGRAGAILEAGPNTTIRLTSNEFVVEHPLELYN